MQAEPLTVTSARDRKLGFSRHLPKLPSNFFALYYAATLAFVLLDYGLGLNVRLAFLEAWPGWRVAYYVACGGCFLLVQRFPGQAALVGPVESLANLVGLILETGVRVMVPSAAVLDSGEPALTVEEAINFLLSGSIAYLSWQSRAREWWRDSRR